MRAKEDLPARGGLGGRRAELRKKTASHAHGARSRGPGRATPRPAAPLDPRSCRHRQPRSPTRRNETRGRPPPPYVAHAPPPDPQEDPHLPELNSTPADGPGTASSGSGRPGEAGLCARAACPSAKTLHLGSLGLVFRADEVVHPLPVGQGLKGQEQHPDFKGKTLTCEVVSGLGLTRLAASDGIPQSHSTSVQSHEIS